MNKEITEQELANDLLEKGEMLSRENFPIIYNLSAAFTQRFMPRPTKKLTPEFVYLPSNLFIKQKDWELELFVAIWSTNWEAGQLRSELYQDDFPKELVWLKKYKNINLYLIPIRSELRYDTFMPLYHLLPKRTLERWGLPLLKRGSWPTSMFSHDRIRYLTNVNFDDNTSKAFAQHIWPLLNSGSKSFAFGKDDPIVVLSHNLNYWLPFAYEVCENRLGKKSRVIPENRDFEEELRNLNKVRKDMPTNIRADFPLQGGEIWWGEDDAWEATKEMVELADEHGNLRAIMDAIQSNRVEDDFSDIWSNAREDFERKLYHKRSKYKVSFVELDAAPPVHSPTSEVHENLLWEDFFVILNKKERHIVVCLKNGITKVGEISKLLGYANHSPVSKSLAKIRIKAKRYLDQS